MYAVIGYWKTKFHAEFKAFATQMANLFQCLAVYGWIKLMQVSMISCVQLQDEVVSPEPDLHTCTIKLITRVSRLTDFVQEEGVIPSLYSNLTPICQG